MARETLPKIPSAKRTPWGSKTLQGKQYYLDNPEEYCRIQEGCVDANGVRTIEIEKEGDKFDNPRLRSYRQMGYSVTDKEFYFEVSIPQADFLAREKRRQDADIARSRAHVRDPDFTKDEDIQLDPVSANDILNA